MNSGGHGGVVTVISTSSGSSVSVAYPADGVSVPPQSAHTDIFSGCPEWAVTALRTAITPAGPCTVTVDGSGAVSSVKVPG